MQNSFSRPRLLFGAILVLVGVGKLIDNLGLFPGFDFRGYWPLVFLIIALGRFLAGDWMRGLVLTALGGTFLLPTVVPSITWKTLFDQWPVFVIAAGILMVVRSFFGSSDAPPPKTDDRVDAFGFFNTYNATIDSDNFRGGELAAFLGGCEIDLREAELAPEGAVLDVFAMWGGLTVRVPDHWVLDLRVLPVMGGAEDKTQRLAASSGGRLVIRGFVTMAGIEVTS